jgi:hypothetical protein
MTENMSNDSPTTKKRKANDGQATVPDSNHHSGGFLSSLLGYFSSGQRDDTPPTASTTCGGENLTQKMDAMMQMMSRMEKRQLASMGSLERRCENLEDKCSSLEHMLETKMEHVDSKFDSLVRHHEYNSMIGKNQSWKYSVPVISAEYWINDGADDDVAQYLAESSGELKEYSEKMRRGEFPDYSDGRKGIHLYWHEDDPILDDFAISKMGPHWYEFVKALEQFTPAFGVLPDDCETYFALDNIQLAGDVAWLLKDALMHKPFQKLCFENKVGFRAISNEGMSVDSIIEIVKSNKHLRKLTVGNNRIQLGPMKQICSAVRHGSIVELDLKNCFENGLGDDMMTSLLINCGSKLQRLGLASNEITSSSITLLANFLATNPMLKELDLANNSLSDDCVDLLANALRSNRSLRGLNFHGNAIGDAGKEAFRLVLYSDSSLNSIADSNNSCSVEEVGFDHWNEYHIWKDNARHEAPESFNRARKIYRLLSERNKSISTSNVQHFDDIDIKILPDMLTAVQTYATVVHPTDHHRAGYCRVEALSIVYEVMRKWDKVFPLYTNGGNNGGIDIE